MGEEAKVAGDGGPIPRNGGAGDESAVCGRRGETRSAAKYTAARRRVRSGRASADTSTLSGTSIDCGLTLKLSAMFKTAVYYMYSMIYFTIYLKTNQLV